MSPLEWLASVTAVVYVFLAARDNNWCWLFAAVSALAWAYVSFFSYRLVSDAILQLFYLFMAGVGIYRWRYKETPDGKTVLPITRMKTNEHLAFIAVCTVVGLLGGTMISVLGIAAQTYLDAITTVFSIGATFLLIGRKLENWLYWVVIDAVYIYIYFRSGATLFMGLMALYTVLAVYGYYQWRSAVDRSDQVAA